MEGTSSALDSSGNNLRRPFVKSIRYIRIDDDILKNAWWYLIMYVNILLIKYYDFFSLHLNLLIIQHYKLEIKKLYIVKKLNDLIEWL